MTQLEFNTPGNHGNARTTWNANAVDAESRLATIEALKLSILGANRTEIFTVADLPAPIGGVITLPAGTYDFRAAVTLSDRLVTATDAVVALLVSDTGLAPVINHTRKGD